MSEVKRVVFQSPQSLYRAMEVAAEKDYSTVSDVCRRAIANELRERGLLNDDVVMA